MVEWALRSLDHGADCSGVNYSSRAMMATWTDGEAGSDSTWHSHAHLHTSITCMQLRRDTATKMLSVCNKDTGINPCQVYCGSQICPPGLLLTLLHLTNSTNTKTTQQAASYELNPDKTGNCLCPAAEHVNTAGKAEVCMNEARREFRC